MRLCLPHGHLSRVRVDDISCAVSGRDVITVHPYYDNNLFSFFLKSHYCDKFVVGMMIMTVRFFLKSLYCDQICRRHDDDDFFFILRVPSLSPSMSSA